MKAYFSGSVFYRDKFESVYRQIVKVLQSMSVEVLENTTKIADEKYDEMTNEDRVEAYKQVLKWVDRSDFCVIEASFPSTLHVGHEISLIVGKGKPLIIVYQKGFDPSLFGISDNDKVFWLEYEKVEDIAKKLALLVHEAKKSADVRFNFFVSPKILTYLDWVAKNRMIPRSVFLRDLIEKEMKKDKDFRG